VLKRAWIAALFSLAGCAHTSVCPPLVEYTEEEQRAASAELGALPEDSQLAVMIVDYGTLRAMLRLCQ
jgi:hypothetical protein